MKIRINGKEAEIANVISAPELLVAQKMRPKEKPAMKAMLVALLFATLNTTQADDRHFAWTYEYMTMPAGAKEVEYYLTVKVPDTRTSEDSAWQHQVEIEYGMTPRWDIALYQVWEEQRTATDSEFQYTGFKMRTRYRVAEEGQLPLDLLLYAEYERDADLIKPDAAEFKLVLAKQWGPARLSYNQILEKPLAHDGDTEHKYAAGCGYAISTHIHIGMESAGNYSAGTCAVGPTIGVSGNECFATVGILWGMTDETADLQSRLIVGMAF